MTAPSCSAALSGQSPLARTGRAFRRAGLTAKAARRAIMAHALESPGNRRRFGSVSPSIKIATSRDQDLATPRRPDRHEVVTHVSGTIRYRCVRAGHNFNGGRTRTRTLDPLIKFKSQLSMIEMKALSFKMKELAYVKYQSVTLDFQNGSAAIAVLAVRSSSRGACRNAATNAVSSMGSLLFRLAG
jgi:hypothetical protein